MTAFPKADIQNPGVKVGLDGCFWPKADVEHRRMKLLWATQIRPVAGVNADGEENNAEKG
jgi:hypothetical protein